MPRNKRGPKGPRTPRPLMNNSRHMGRPPGLKGKEIGLYYRNLKLKNNKQATDKKRWLHLKIPQTVIIGIYNCLEKIESMAVTKNIYIPPVKKLELVAPPVKVDYIPLNAPDSEKLVHEITNIRKRDEDVLYVKTVDPEVVEILDLSEDADMDAESSQASERIKEEVGTIKEENEQVFMFIDTQGAYASGSSMKTKTEIHRKRETMNIKEEPKEVKEQVFMSVDTPSTSAFGNIKLETHVKREINEETMEDKAETNENKQLIFKSVDPYNPIPSTSASGSTTETKVGACKDYLQKLKEDIKKKNYHDANKKQSPLCSTIETKVETSEPEKRKINEDREKITTSDDNNCSTNEHVEVTGFFVSNNYTNRTPSTSATNNEYKYGYDDIITGTFHEKLDECLSRGIEITKRSPDIDRLNQSLKENQKDMMMSNLNYKKMLDFRQTLPTYKKASHLLDVINRNQVVVISGETGCGKSTQVPQLILDQAFVNGTGANVKILVTEPRRIAASSLAARVAEERGERMGASVGYAVRLESVQCRDRGSIMFCTTGVLLVELEQNQALTGYSHVILDEVHERDCQVDIAMCMLKQVLKKRKDLKLILMSATIDAETLSIYYDDCPMLHIEGLAYPVKDVYLEEILALTNFRLPATPSFLSQPKAKWHKYAYKSRDAVSDIEKEMQYRASIAVWLDRLKKALDPSIIETLENFKIEELNLKLVLELLKYICRGEPGAVLVFLPGISEISKLMNMMTESHAFQPSSHDIYALHSKLPTIDQNKIFKRPPNNVRKIILATNIAETSITIDDVVYVIDCGKMKYKGLDVEKNHATLQNEWISKANLRQRRGRAGRCQPGICYHLLTTFRAENIPDRLLPELQRSNLLEEVLCMKKLRLGKAEEALKNMPAVPAEKTIHAAIKHLQQVGAIDEKETLTPLGWHLARLPVHPAAGKLLVLGSLFGCLDRAASVAAVWGFKDPFQLVMGRENEVDRARREFASGEPSDHVAISEAIIQWEHSDNRWAFARRYFLSNNTLQLLSDMKKQFANNLKEMGFLYRADIRSPWENRNHDNLSLFKALVAAALYPNVANVSWRNEHQRNPNKPMRIIAYTPEDGKVSMHPSSVMHTKMGRVFNRQPICQNTGAKWLVYWLKQKSSELFLIDVTCVYTLPLLFFGDLNFTTAENPDECLISMSSLKICCMRETAQLLYRLRSLLDQVLTSKISRMEEAQSKKRIEFDQEVLRAVIELITAEDVGTQYLGGDDDDDDAYEAVPSDQGYDFN